jgi:hypothetical protein
MRHRIPPPAARSLVGTTGKDQTLSPHLCFKGEKILNNPLTILWILR